jgi:micrococcal nuclease
MLDIHNCYNTAPFSLNGRVVRARVVNIYDGDTITAIIELHPGYYCQFKFRMNGIDTPEIKGEDKAMALKARNRVIYLITSQDVSLFSPRTIKEFLNSNFYIVYVRCFHFEKYGRVLADIYTTSDIERTKSINQILLEEGLAKPYFGGKK